MPVQLQDNIHDERVVSRICRRYSVLRIGGRRVSETQLFPIGILSIAHSTVHEVFPSTERDSCIVAVVLCDLVVSWLRCEALAAELVPSTPLVTERTDRNHVTVTIGRRSLLVILVHFAFLVVLVRNLVRNDCYDSDGCE